MVTLLLALALAQASVCGPEAMALMKAARARAEAFDLAGALDRLAAASKTGCAEAQVSATYLRGWIAAREAYRAGGSPESLKDVGAAVAALNKTGEQLPAYVLQAAAAAAQSERDSLSLLLQQAVQLESIRLSAGLTGAPIITAHEAAGDLWLQVHRYEEARRAYLRAAERVGATRRVTGGLARSAARLNDVAAACLQYRALVGAWSESGAEPPEIVEAREFIRTSNCQASAPPGR